MSDLYTHEDTNFLTSRHKLIYIHCIFNLINTLPAMSELKLIQQFDKEGMTPSLLQKFKEGTKTLNYSDIEVLCNKFIPEYGPFDFEDEDDAIAHRDLLLSFFDKSLQ